MLAEVSGAAAVAAALSGKLGDLRGKRVVCTVSGGLGLGPHPKETVSRVG